MSRQSDTAPVLTTEEFYRYSIDRLEFLVERAEERRRTLMGSPRWILTGDERVAELTALLTQRDALRARFEELVENPSGGEG